MNTFFLEFRDPLFGIIIFFVLVFMIAIVSYWLTKLKLKEEDKHLDKFLKQFKTVPSQKELQVLITSGELSEKSWLLLAHSYTKNGDFEKSIEIYSELLKVGDKKNYRDILFLLGKTYFKAGFLQRSKQVFLEILKTDPRTPQALKYLLLVNENMRDYSSALEILEPLDELKIDVSAERVYLNSLIVLNNTKLSSEDKVIRLFEMYQKTNKMAYLIFEYIFRIDSKFAWEHFDYSKVEQLVDILWNLDKKDIDFSSIAQNSYLRELYTAKGYIQEATKSSIFEFDVLINLDSSVSATLSFEYVCDNCKQVFPFIFNRCSSCHSIDTSRVELGLTKSYDKDFSEENNSFQ